MQTRGFGESEQVGLTVDAAALVGSFHRIGHYGPPYEVLRLIDEKEALIVLLETGEEVEYPIADILTDPDPDEEAPPLP